MDREDKLKEYREVIGKILKAFEKVSFPVIVEATTNTRVEVFDLKTTEDRTLVRELSQLANLTMWKFHESSISVARINEVSNYIEKVLPDMFRSSRSEFKVIDNVEFLGRTGYPDEKITEVTGRITYIEVKATKRPDTGSPRDFYFTPLEKTRKKVRESGRHALLGFIIRGEPHAFKTVGWKLSDLSKIEVSIKPEFNADNKEIYKREAIVAEGKI